MSICTDVLGGAASWLFLRKVLFMLHLQAPIGECRWAFSCNQTTYAHQNVRPPRVTIKRNFADEVHVVSTADIGFSS